MIEKKSFEYQVDGVSFEGYYACDSTQSAKKPTILVCHDYSGIGEFSKNKAEELAKLGYIGVAIDVYGKGNIPHTTPEKKAAMQNLINDRPLLQKRLSVALDTAKNFELVDTTKMGAIGFCFGGLCVLDLARMGADIKVGVSFHGALLAPNNISNPKIKTKLLVLHGYKDPMIKPEQVFIFSEEMQKAEADWQLNMYGNAMHAFTNPASNDKENGMMYDKCATEKAWREMQDFFTDCFK